MCSSDLAIANARTVLGDENALQYEVDEAIEILREAVAGLEKISVNRDALKAFVALAETKNEEEYIPSTWVGFASSLEVAYGVIANDAATQEEIDIAYNNLVRAYLQLRLIPDKSKLEDLINRVNNLDLSIFTEASVMSLNVALGEAAAILDRKSVV